MPKRTISTDNSIDIGWLRVDIKYYPFAHTNADLVLFVEEDGVIITGDIVRNGVIPSWEMESGAHIDRHIAALDDLLRREGKFKYIVPGNGNVAGFEIVHAQRNFLLDLLGAVKTFKAEGKSLAEAKEKIALSNYSTWVRYEGGRQAAIDCVWQMLQKE